MGLRGLPRVRTQHIQYMQDKAIMSHGCAFPNPAHKREQKPMGFKDT